MTMLRSILALAAGLALASCTEYEPLSLNGAGSMRVEVEVYKGPVTLSPEAQIGQTAAVLSDFVRAMDQWHDEAAGYLGYDGNAIDTPEPAPSIPADSTAVTPEQKAAAKAEWGTAMAGYDKTMKYDVQRSNSDPAQNNYDEQWSEYQRRFQHALKDKHRCVAYAQASSGHRLDQNDWRDCQALLAAYRSSERSIASACYIMKTPGFEMLALSVYQPFATCEKYKTSGWDYLYDEAKFGDPQRPADLKGQTNYDILSSGMDGRSGWKNCAGLPPAPPAQSVSVTPIVDAFKKCSEAIVVTMEGFTTELQSTAFRAADSNIRYVPHDRNYRGLLASYAYIASEYGNQMSSRVAVLRKELVAEAGKDKEAKERAKSASAGTVPADNDTADIHGLLPTGDYLRGAQHSDFAHLYEWLSATDGWQPGQMNTAARVRMADRLSNDYYWEKVNEVYASGQGDVSMAFIKDEIGNWNLKSFSNDPAKLLAAYRSVADATLKTAGKLAGMAASGGGTMALPRLGAAQQAAAFATQLSGGNTAASNAPDMAAMHARVVAHIRARVQTFQKREADATADVTKYSAVLATGATPAEQDAQKASLTEAQSKLLTVRKDAIAALRDIMEDDSAVLGEMQLAVAHKDTSQAPKDSSQTTK